LSCPCTSDHERSLVLVKLVRAVNRNLFSELGTRTRVNVNVASDQANQRGLWVSLLPSTANVVNHKGWLLSHGG